MIKELHWEQSLLQFYSFGQNIAENIENPQTELLSHTKINGLQMVDEFKNLELWEISRLRLMNEIPLILETSYIPVEFLNKFTEKDLEQDSLYNLLMKNNSKVIKAKEYLEPVLPSLKDQELLDIKEDSCLFQTLRYSYSTQGELVELRESLISSAYFSFSVEMTL